MYLDITMPMPDTHSSAKMAYTAKHSETRFAVFIATRYRQADIYAKRCLFLSTDLNRVQHSRRREKKTLLWILKTISTLFTRTRAQFFIVAANSSALINVNCKLGARVLRDDEGRVKLCDEIQSNGATIGDITRDFEKSS